MPVLGLDLALHLGIELGINLAGAAAPPPVLEAPLTIPGMKAWFDSRDPSYFALGGGGEVNAWLSRAGSIAGLAWTQGTAANQPIRVASEPLFNNQPALLFDGVNDQLITNNQPAFTFMHDGSGHANFRIYRLDSSLAASQGMFANHNGGATQSGVFHLYTVAPAAQMVIAKGSSPPINTWTNAVAGHSTRDVARWQMLGHVLGAAHSRVSGSSLTNADASGPPSVAPPTTPSRLGSTTSGLGVIKGHVVQDLYYDHVLTAGETTTLANWAAATYGVAA